MPLPDTTPDHESELSQTKDSTSKPADFMVDSAGNVAPSSKPKPASRDGRAAAPEGRWFSED